MIASRACRVSVESSGVAVSPGPGGGGAGRGMRPLYAGAGLLPVEASREGERHSLSGVRRIAFIVLSHN